MLRSVRSNKPTFKTINFNPGFNVVTAERTKESSKKDSRNGLGKSTLIEIIQFCLGGGKGETLKKPQMEDWEFTLDLDLKGRSYSVSRNTSSENKIIIDGDFSDWILKPKIDSKTGRLTISNEDWKAVLGTLIFELSTAEDQTRYAPTFRSLISYFVRKNGQSGAFLSPFTQYKNQLEWDIQVNNAFLLGLGWEYASEWQILKDRLKSLSQLEEEAKTGIISQMFGSLGELETRKIRLEVQQREEEKELSEFKVYPQYEAIENEANLITRSIHDRINKNVDDRRLLEFYENSLTEETDASPDKIKEVYSEAGLLFPNNVSQKLEEIMQFHKTVVLNRKEFLKTELERITRSISSRESEIMDFTSKRAALFGILKEYGALKEFTTLQTRHQATIADLKDTTNRLENLTKFEREKSSVKVDKELLYQATLNDLKERKVQKEEAVVAFNRFSKELYDAPGILTIDVTKNGYKYSVNIERSGSHGIGNMKIFCYDLTLGKLWGGKSPGNIFVVHDSLIFADVDERQKALALQLAKRVSHEEGFQYICTMNSDSIPWNEFSPDFEFKKYIVSSFTDATPDGGLLGIRLPLSTES